MYMQIVYIAIFFIHNTHCAKNDSNSYSISVKTSGRSYRSTSEVSNSISGMSSSNYEESRLNHRRNKSTRSSKRRSSSSRSKSNSAVSRISRPTFNESEDVWSETPSTAIASTGYTLLPNPYANVMPQQWSSYPINPYPQFSPVTPVPHYVQQSPSLILWNNLPVPSQPVPVQVYVNNITV